MPVLFWYTRLNLESSHSEGFEARVGAEAAFRGAWGPGLWKCSIKAVCDFDID